MVLPYGLDSNVAKLLANLLPSHLYFVILPIVKCYLVLIFFIIIIIITEVSARKYGMTSAVITEVGTRKCGMTSAVITEVGTRRYEPKKNRKGLINSWWND